jgi:hypothetical protein
MKCKFCEKPVYDDIIHPGMCEPHADLALVVAHLERTKEPVTVEAVQLVLATTEAGALTFTKDEVPGMLKDLGYGEGAVNGRSG